MSLQLLAGAVVDDLHESLNIVQQQSDQLRELLGARAVTPDEAREQARVAAAFVTSWEAEIDQLLRQSEQLHASLQQMSIARLYESCMRTQQQLSGVEATLFPAVSTPSTVDEAAAPKQTLCTEDGIGSASPLCDSMARLDNDKQQSRGSLPTPPPLTIDPALVAQIAATPVTANNRISHLPDLTRTPTLEDLGLSAAALSLLKKTPPKKVTSSKLAYVTAATTTTAVSAVGPYNDDDDDDENCWSDQEIENLTAQLHLTSHWKGEGVSQ